MSIAHELRQLIQSGFHRIGQIELQTHVGGSPYVICHHEDAELSKQPAFGGLTLHHDPNAARDLSIYADDGTYRFTKGQTNLKRGWVLALQDEEELRRALDLFYPAAVALFIAQNAGTLQIQNLRDKLNRQTGMYRYARNVSTDGAQQLIQKVCGPSNQCAKRILWHIETPLDDSEASRFTGISGNLNTSEAIPLLCREACNHFVAECRQLAKEESNKA
jgi:sirohydrochlorin cobaltochelatase